MGSCELVRDGHTSGTAYFCVRNQCRALLLHLRDRIKFLNLESWDGEMEEEERHLAHDEVHE